MVMFHSFYTIYFANSLQGANISFIGGCTGRPTLGFHGVLSQILRPRLPNSSFHVTDTKSLMILLRRATVGQGRRSFRWIMWVLILYLRPEVISDA